MYEPYFHGMRVADLRELLKKLRDDDIVIPNELANLKVVRGDVYVGYVDFGTEEVSFASDHEGPTAEA